MHLQQEIPAGSVGVTGLFLAIAVLQTSVTWPVRCIRVTHSSRLIGAMRPLRIALQYHLH